MDKNTIVGLVLIGLILVLSPWLMKQLGYNQPAASPPEEVQIAPVQAGATEEAVQTTPAPVIARAVSPPASAAVTAPADTVVIETDLYTAVVTNIGGGTIIGWELKKHLVGDKADNRPVNLVPENSSGNLGIMLDGANLDLGNVPFRLSGPSSYSEGGVAYQKLVFSYPFSGGGSLDREYTFRDDTYAVQMEVSFNDVSPTEYHIYWNSGIAPTEKDDAAGERYLESFALQAGELLKTKEKATGYTEGYTDWTALRNKYFVAAIIPADEPAAGASLEGEKIELLDENGKQFRWKRMQMALFMPGDRSSETYAVYLGPLDYHMLKNMDVGLEKVMNWGWSLIKPISIAFFYVLQFLYGIVGNYGWAIIIFSIMIKIVLYPLTRKSYESMQAMQALQPQMEAIKTKFKDDPQRMNQETMKLYKKHGVNPMGGCLPMLLQMPVLFALFNLFRTTIMLRQAEFLGGLIPDLSAPDGIIGGTIHVLPILMGITMIVQQRLTMRDPKQKAMAYMMPIMFSFIFYRMASGLNLYYLMFNLLTIAQEVLIKKRKPEETEG
ncbi:membrane protein insertase YidC [bacterium]|nr:membrane protein insertase YidC [bacterium]